MTIDPELVTRKLVLITSDLESLRSIASQGLDHYLQSRFDQAVVERYLERVVGRMIDINYHVITESGQPPPADYHASFMRLVELGLLEPEFAQRIARAAGLRNRLVHEYEEIDSRKVFEALDAALRDIPVYLARVNEFIMRGGQRA